jgi:hypothetical protein
MGSSDSGNSGGKVRGATRAQTLPASNQYEGQMISPSVFADAFST